jgi:hypothetical protein
MVAVSGKGVGVVLRVAVGPLFRVLALFSTTGGTALRSVYSSSDRSALASLSRRSTRSLNDPFSYPPTIATSARNVRDLFEHQCKLEHQAAHRSNGTIFGPPPGAGRAGWPSCYLRRRETTRNMTAERAAITKCAPPRKKVAAATPMRNGPRVWPRRRMAPFRLRIAPRFSWGAEPVRRLRMFGMFIPERSRRSQSPRTAEAKRERAVR